jgi:FkbM family methyltransferase
MLIGVYTKGLYIDGGGNTGQLLATHMRWRPGLVYHIFEPNPALHDAIRARMAEHARCEAYLHAAALWNQDTELDLVLGDTPQAEGSTVLAGKQTGGVGAGGSVRVRAVDTARWIREHASVGGEVVLKLNVEGAEYAILERLLETGVMGLVRELWFAPHVDKIESITRERHDALIAGLWQWGHPLWKEQIWFRKGS